MGASYYWTGFVVGFLLASFIGWMFSRIQLERKRVGAHKKPQRVVVPSPHTPADVLKGHRLAILKIIGMLLVISISFGLIVILSIQLL